MLCEISAFLPRFISIFDGSYYIFWTIYWVFASLYRGSTDQELSSLTLQASDEPWMQALASVSLW